MLLMGYAHMVPSKEPRDGRRRDGEEDKGMPSGVVGDHSTAAAALKAERYRPKIFGFGVHEISKWMRWQEAVRDKFVVFLCPMSTSSHLLAQANCSTRRD
jgi:casein kinase II subunit beta